VPGRPDFLVRTAANLRQTVKRVNPIPLYRCIDEHCLRWRAADILKHLRKPDRMIGRLIGLNAGRPRHPWTLFDLHHLELVIHGFQLFFHCIGSTTRLVPSHTSKKAEANGCDGRHGVPKGRPKPISAGWTHFAPLPLRHVRQSGI
jgi:hypothetical protein